MTVTIPMHTYVWQELRACDVKAHCPDGENWSSSPEDPTCPSPLRWIAPRTGHPNYLTCFVWDVQYNRGKGKNFQKNWSNEWRKARPQLTCVSRSQGFGNRLILKIAFFLVETKLPTPGPLGWGYGNLIQALYTSPLYFDQTWQFLAFPGSTQNIFTLCTSII